jgi:hypothetical protein
MRKARIALARRLAIICMRCCDTEQSDRNRKSKISFIWVIEME